MPSWQARCFSYYSRLVIRRRDWGPAAALARRARRLFGAPPLLQRYAVRGMRVTSVATRSGVRGEWLAHPRLSATDGQRRILMYDHGGGYVAGSAATHRPVTTALARVARCRVFASDYRLAPEARFPAAIDDILAAYHWLVTEEAPGVPVVVVGESAGGGLVLLLAQHARARGWPAPAGVAALSPWTDLAGEGASLTANDGRCDMFRPENINAFAAAYLGGASPRDPRASPLFGAMEGLPPVLLQVGSTELLLDDATRMHDRLQAAGGNSKLSVYQRVAHGWQLLSPYVPEATAAVQELADFAAAHWARATPPRPAGSGRAV